MSVEVRISDGPLPAVSRGAAGAGAVVCFEGVVRGEEDGRALDALDYEAYEPMASRELAALAERSVHKHALLGIDVWHSRGRVAVGEVSFRLIVRAAHRAEGLAAMSEFIDEMKRDVPIWKSPVWKE